MLRPGTLGGARVDMMRDRESRLWWLAGEEEEGGGIGWLS